MKKLTQYFDMVLLLRTLNRNIKLYCLLKSLASIESVSFDIIQNNLCKESSQN